MILHCSRINAVSNAQVRGDSYESGCLGRTGKYGTRSVCWRESPAGGSVQDSHAPMLFTAFEKKSQCPQVLKKPKLIVYMCVCVCVFFMLLRVEMKCYC